MGCCRRMSRRGLASWLYLALSKRTSRKLEHHRPKTFWPVFRSFCETFTASDSPKFAAALDFRLEYTCIPVSTCNCSRNLSACPGLSRLRPRSAVPQASIAFSYFTLFV